MNQPTGIPTITPRDAAAEADTGRALIVDVRERDEFAAERAPGVALIPLSEFVARHEELPKDRPLRMICAAGSRSAQATAFLLQRGWTDVKNVTGGMMAWSGAGLPTKGGRPSPDEPQRRLYTERMRLLGGKLSIEQSTSDEPIPSGLHPLDQDERERSRPVSIQGLETRHKF